jgi:hypothetical protein
MQKVLNVIDKGLSNTHKQMDWGFASWPILSALSGTDRRIPNKLFDKYRTFKVTLGIFNSSYGTPISTIDIDLHGQLAYLNKKIGADSSQNLTVLFPNVPVDMIDTADSLVIRVVSIDNIQVYQSEENNILGITVAAKRLPWKQGPSIPSKDRLIPQSIPEKSKTEADDTKPKDQPAATQAGKETMPLEYRIGVSALNLANSSKFDAMDFYADIEIGLKHWTFEGFVFQPWRSNPLNSIFNWKKPLDFGFGFGLGWTLVGRNALATLEAGYLQYHFYDEGTIHVPFAQFKLDILPWELGLGLRLGYIVEAGIPSDSKGSLYFDESSTFGSDKLRFKGKLISGLVLWL